MKRSLDEIMLNLPLNTDLATQAELDDAVQNLQNSIEYVDTESLKKREFKEKVNEELSGYQIYSDNISSVSNIKKITEWTKALHDTFVSIANLSTSSDIDGGEISALKETVKELDFKLSSLLQTCVKQNDDATLFNLYTIGEAGKLKEEYVEQISYLYGKKYTDNDEVQFDFSNAIELRYFGINNRDLIGIDDYNFTINLSSSDETYSVLDNTIKLDDEEELESSVLKYLIESETISSLYVNRDDLSKISVCFVSEEMDTFDLASEEDESGIVSSVNEFVTADSFNETSVKVDTSLSTIKEKIENVDFLSNSVSQPSLDEISRRCDLFLDILKSL